MRPDALSVSSIKTAIIHVCDYSRTFIYLNFDMISTRIKRHLPFKNYATSSEATSYPGSFFGEGKTLVGAGHVM